MADIEPRVESLENRVTTLELKVDQVMTKLDMFIEESREARQRQYADMREMRQQHDDDMREMRQKHDDDMREMRQDMKNMQISLDAKIDGMGKHVRNMSVVTIIGIAAMVVAVFLK